MFEIGQMSNPLNQPFRPIKHHIASVLFSHQLQKRISHDYWTLDAVMSVKNVLSIKAASGSEEEVVGRLGVCCCGSSSSQIDSASMSYWEDAMKPEGHVLQTMGNISIFRKCC